VGPFFYRLEVFVATKLFVGNLSFQVNTAELEALFSQVGAVESVNVITDKFSGQSRGFGFVEMTDAQAAQQAITQFHGSEFQGRALTVNEARPRPERTGGGRSSSGGYGRGGRSSSDGYGRGTWNKPSGGSDRRW
jgi:RNA recognition motif-containing protein